MEYFFYDSPNKELYDNINKILFSCRNNNEVIYSLNEDSQQDFDFIIIAENDRNPLGFLAASYIDINTFEIIGAVTPQNRRNGIFKEMLEEFNTIVRPLHIVFSGKSTYNGFSECAHALGYSVMNCEHLMEFDRNKFIPKQATVIDAEFDEEASTYYYYIEDNFIGSCSICDETYVINIYDVYVEPEYRNRGYGSIILSDVLWDLINSGKRIQLQVSGQNKAALKLYKKCGFTTTDTIILYSQ